ncbi:protein SRG1-like [Trifolium pratense]|uniref:protein SRG1-like n=1 Tax=Trifolium pratense TaxID=57577 RepID=UPI001E6975DC|nr:protein SRG1-like [Trifolium pratense]
MKRDTKTLFELPKEEKKKLWQKEGKMEGFGQAFILSEEQKLEWAELEKLAIKIIELMANALAINPKEMTELFNIGTQIIRIITNGIYPIIVHRATVNSEKERISLATFYGPNMQAILAPAPSLVTQERPTQFRKISVVDHFNGYFSQVLHGKSYLNQMKIT